MINITKDDLLEWKANPSLRKIREAVREYIRVEQLQLARRAGRDPNTDLYKSGYYNGIEDVLFNLELIVDTPEEESKKND